MCVRRWFSSWALSWCQTFCGWIEGLKTLPTKKVTMFLFVLCFCWALQQKRIARKGWGRGGRSTRSRRRNQWDVVPWCTAQPHTLFAAGHASGRGFFVPAVRDVTTVLFFCCGFLFWSITQAHARVTQNTRVFHWSFSGLWRTSNKYKLCSTKNWAEGVGFHWLELNVWICDIWVWKPCPQKKTYPATMDFFWCWGFFWNVTRKEEGGRRSARGRSTRNRKKNGCSVTNCVTTRSLQQGQLCYFS